METQSLQYLDSLYVWHPFTQAKTALAPIPIVKGERAYLIDEEGNRYFDAVSSWWVNLHGHAHPHIAGKIAKQALQIEQVIFAGCTHYPAIHLAKRLVELLGITKGKVFFSDNGSTAVEAALKIAIQYQHRQSHGQPKRKILALEGGYHGDTFGAMSAGGKGFFHKPFWPYLFEVEMIEPPYPGREEKVVNRFKELVNKGDAACFIFEPLVQGAGRGMTRYSLEGLQEMIKICRKNGVVTIADEVMTGFGRLGPLFVSHLLPIKPDLICLSKGITGGFLPLGATIAASHIHESFLSDKLEDAFLHGHSYSANPLACAAALASLDLLEGTSCAHQRDMIEKNHRRFVSDWNGHSKLCRCESTGTLLAIEYATKDNTYFSSLRNQLYSFFLENGILVRPLGNVLYLLPPYCTGEEQLKTFYSHIIETLETDFIS